MNVSIIVAVAQNGVIGRAGTLPWHLSPDLRRFKHLTMGHAIIMGRKTYESIGKPLPGRRSIVVSRNLAFSAPGVEVALTLQAALDLAAGDTEAFVIGGASLYQEVLPLANRLYLTRVLSDIPGDTFFPEPNPSQWRLTGEDAEDFDPASSLRYRFEQYERVRRR